MQYVPRPDARSFYREQPSNLRSLVPSELFSLRDRVALVTGAGGGVGGWLVLGLAAAGASVVLSDLTVEKCADLAKVLENNNVASSLVAADLREVDSPARIVSETIAAFGRLDILINAAAVNHRMPIEDVSVREWTEISDVNLRSVYFLCQEAMLAMRAGHGGSIINVTSINSHMGFQDVSVYGAHKAALTQASKVMSVEWARYGIRVNSITPGFLMTALSRPLWDDPVRSRWIVDRCPLRRPGEPRELVGACLLLASDAGSFITGTSICIDGGLLAGSPWDGGV